MSAVIEATPTAEVPQNGAIAALSVVAEQLNAPPPPPTTEPPQEVPQKPSEAPKDRMSERFALLARREREVVQRQMDGQRQIAAMRARLKTESETLAAERQRYEEMGRRLDEAKTNPKAFLESLYGSDYYDHITKLQLADDGVPPAEMQVQAVRDELLKTTEELKQQQNELRERMEAEKKAAIAAEKQRLTSETTETLERFNSEVIDFVKANPAKYELINLYGRHDLVPMVIKATYEQSKANGTPRLLSEQEAADVVEGYLGEEIAKAERLKQQKAQAVQQPIQTPPSQPVPTLTNAMGGTPAIPVKKSTGDFRADAMRRAMQAWEAKESKR
jgi:hypothetical protein